MSFDASQFKAGLQAAARAQTAKLTAGCVAYCEHIIADSQELCPVSPIAPEHPGYTGHSGNLRDSAVVKDAEVDADKIHVEGGYNTNYAAAVHEVLTANHQYPGAVNPKAQAKFLETSLRNNTPGFLPFLEKFMGGGNV